MSGAYVVDCETTGTVEPIEPVEVAWLKLRGPTDLTVVETFTERFKTGKAIELGALATHFIEEGDLVDCRPSSECRLPEDCTIIAGWNIDYDWKVLGSPRVRRIDVAAMAWRVWPELGKVKLGAAVYHVARARARELLESAHGSLQDCHNTLLVLRAICQEAPAFDTWRAMWEYSEEARTPDTFMFGKHKGVKIADSPLDYRAWCLRQPDFDPYVVKAIRRTMGFSGPLTEAFTEAAEAGGMA